MVQKFDQKRKGKKDSDKLIFREEQLGLLGWKGLEMK